MPAGSVRVFGIPLTKVASLAGAVRVVRDKIVNRPSKAFLVSSVNPYALTVMRSNAAYVDHLNRMDAVFCDGLSMANAARRFCDYSMARVSPDSTSLAPEVFRIASQHGASVVFVGGRPGVAERAANQISRTFPQLKIVGTFNGYGPMDATVATVAALDPRVVFCGMGAPRQEAFLIALADAGWTGCGFTCGGYFDQLANGFHYYPRLVDRLNLRFLYRLASEPRRLGYRYFICYQPFVFAYAKLLIARAVAVALMKEVRMKSLRVNDALAPWLPLLRHRFVSAAIFVATLGVTAGFLVLSEPRYRASALVMIDLPREVVKVDPVAPGSPIDSEAIASEIQVLQSQELLAHAASVLDLAHNDEFDPTKPSVARRLVAMLEPYITWPGGLVRAKLNTEAQKIDAVVDEIRKRLDVASAGRRSRVISVTFKSRDPRLAATFVNELTDLYVSHQSDTKEKATRQANELINGKLAGLRAKAEASGRRLERFRATTGMIEGKDTTLMKQHISELSTQLTDATQARLAAAAKLAETKRATSYEIGSDATSPVLASRLVQELRAQQAQIAARVAGMTTRLGDRNPILVEARSELANIKNRINTEIRKIIVSVQGDYSSAVEREQALFHELESAKTEMIKVSDDEARLNELQREAQADRSLYANFLERANETGVKNIQIPDARVISYPAISQKPYFPNPKLVIPAGVVLASVLSMLGAVLVETRERGFRSKAELERALGVPAIGFFPSTKRADHDADDPDPLSILGAAITDLQMRLCTGEAPKCLAITSALPQEGKTTLSLYLSRIAAINGYRVLLIDADLRRSGLRNRLDVLAGAGLSDYIHGRSSFEETLRQDDASGITIMACGSPSRNPAGLLASRRMRTLLDIAKEKYNFIVIDTPAVMAGPDAWMVSKVADETVLFVRWATTARTLATTAMEQLVSAGAKVTGVALTMVDLKKISEYSATDGINHSMAIRQYYPHDRGSDGAIAQN